MTTLKTSLRIEKTPVGEGVALTYKAKLSPGKIAKILLAKHKNYFNIDWIEVPKEFRDEGIANSLMAQLLDDADGYSKVLRLVAVACGDVRQSRLERWYESYGFEEIGWNDKLGGPIMERLPQ